MVEGLTSSISAALGIGNMLERLGCTVDIVSNGQEAIDGIMAHDYDAILMDVSMPEMDGIAATKIIRGLDGEINKTPIIALTAYDKLVCAIIFRQQEAHIIKF